MGGGGGGDVCVCVCVCVCARTCEERHSCDVLTIPDLPPHNGYVTQREADRQRDRQTECMCVHTRMHARPYVKEETLQWCSNHTPAPVE